MGKGSVMSFSRQKDGDVVLSILIGSDSFPTLIDFLKNGNGHLIIGDIYNKSKPENSKVEILKMQKKTRLFFEELKTKFGKKVNMKTKEFSNIRYKHRIVCVSEVLRRCEAKGLIEITKFGNKVGAGYKFEEFEILF